MTWVDIGVQTGKAPAANSVPVVQAADSEVVVDDTDVLNSLNEIRQFVAALASAKGILSDLRVTVLNPTGTAVTISSGTVTTVTTVTTLTGITNAGGLPLNNAVPNWTNQTAIQSFVNNVVRP